MDWNRPTKLLRPNPDWEEDLFLTCEVTPAIKSRVEFYTAKHKKRKPKKECECKSWTTPGVAPRLTLNNDLTIPSLGIGTWLGYDDERKLLPVKDYSLQNALEVAIDKGYRLIDTAPSYRTEFLVGWAVYNKIQAKVVRREDMFIVTKLPNNCHGEKAVVPALKKSLEDLHLDYVDLYLIHWPVGIHEDGSYDTTDYVDTWNGMVEARVQGLTKAIGLSNFNQRQIARLLATAKIRPAVLQIEVNLNLQQAPLIEYCRRNDIVVMGYSPFGSLFPWRAKRDAPLPRSFTRDLMVIAEKYHKTVPQIVLRYLIELGVVPIPKAMTLDHIEKNLEVFNFELNKKEREFLAKYDKKYRTMRVSFWRNSPFYPFEIL